MAEDDIYGNKGRFEKLVQSIPNLTKKTKAGARDGKFEKILASNDLIQRLRGLGRYLKLWLK